MMERTYNVTITETSRELTTKERIWLKDVTEAVKLDQATSDGNGVIIAPGDWAVLDVHNEKAKGDKDYKNYIITDRENGIKYVTGSKSFWNAFTEILEEMEGTGEEWSIRVYRRPSKNFQGKDFLTCSIV